MLRSLYSELAIRPWHRTIRTGGSSLGPRRAIGGPQTPGRARRGLGSSPRLSPSRPRGKAGVGESCAAWEGERRCSWKGWGRRRLGAAKAAPPGGWTPPDGGSRTLHPLGPARTRTCTAARAALACAPTHTRTRTFPQHSLRVCARAS